ncbi:MAG: hypothetical protein HC836_47425, partial [Richelia sp. RM2_1_2]|nr:hypothetical protein [Richelia sp. RM2_1_2]
PHIDSWVKAKLRKISVQWPGRTIAMGLARIERGLYKCANCKKGFRKGHFHLDHIESVIPMDGEKKRKNDPKRVDFNEYLDRLFVPPEKYQVLCVFCHETKSTLENSMRQYYKDEKKKPKKTKLGQKLIKSLKEVVKKDK